MVHQEEKPGPGRPRAMDAVMKKLALRYIASGLGRGETARLLGIDRSTLRRERQQDEDFASGLLQAEARGEMQLIKTIMRARKTDWKAAAWILERKFPERWCVRDRRELAELTQRLRDIERDISRARSQGGGTTQANGNQANGKA